MRGKNIEKRTLAYFLLRTWASFWHNHVFYKKIVYLHKENVPANAHLLFTINHQNALMDAMALVCTLTSQPVFMARSDIFKNPVIASLLTMIKILPIYRIRDGYDSLRKNDAIFQKTMDVIRNHNGIGILPEGSHEGLHRLRPLKKGFARIAFQTEEASNFQLDIKIIPVGLDYTNYENYRSGLLINFGEPISVSDFYKDYKENTVLATNRLRDTLHEHLKKQIIHIESDKYYVLYDQLRNIYREKMCERMSFPNSDYPYRYFADKELINLLAKYEAEHPDQMDNFQDMVSRHQKLADNLNLTPDQLNHPAKSVLYFISSFLGLLLTFPIFAYGWLNFILPYNLSLFLAKKIKDPQFRSSFKFVLSMVFFPLFHIIQTLLLRIFTPDWIIPLIYFITLPLTGVLAYLYYSFYKKRIENLRYRKAGNKNSKEFEELKLLHNEIIEKVEKLTYG